MRGAKFCVARKLRESASIQRVHQAHSASANAAEVTWVDEGWLRKKHLAI
jgi:hypothetical protein